MAPKVLSLFKRSLYAAFLVGFSNCQNTEEGANAASSVFMVDTSRIPRDTISVMDKKLQLDNGIYYFGGKPYSGFIKEKYENQHPKSIMSVANGMQQGITYTYFPTGKVRDVRSYKANKSYGRHIGYWENGKQKFDFFYINDKREGTHKQWYETGKPYAFLHFKDDKEAGMQQAWRENGKIYVNYEAKDGFRYGLQKASLCYTLRNEKLKLK